MHYGWASYLSILAFISLSLALFDLLPLLPLDGGHIPFSLLEGIRGRAIAREVYERVSAVGITLFLLLFIIGLSNDVGRLAALKGHGNAFTTLQQVVQGSLRGGG